jgi:hypothetical protein
VDVPLYAQGFDPLQREARLPLWRRHLDNAGADHPFHAELLREAELLRLHRRRFNGETHRRLAQTPLANWVGARRCGVRGWAYRGGFIEALACTAEAWRDHAPLLRRLGPIRLLKLHDGDVSATRSWAELDFAGLEVVSLEGQWLAGATFRTMLSAANSRGLPVLDLRRCQVWYDQGVDSWLRARPATELPRPLHRLPDPRPARLYPQPFLPTEPREPWLKAWLGG